MKRKERQARRQRDWLIDRDLVSQEDKIGLWVLILAFTLFVVGILLGRK